MKRRIFSGLIAFLAIMVLVVGSAWPQGLSVSQAQTSLAEGVLFADNFDDGNADGWTISGDNANWNVRDGHFGGRLEGRWRNSFASAGDPSWTDYVFEADVLAEAGVAKCLLFHYRDANNNYGVVLRGLYAGRASVSLFKREAGVWTADIKEHLFPNVLNIWYHLKISLEGRRIRVWVNNVFCIDYVDQQTTLTSGQIALTIHTGEEGVDAVRFDNVEVRGLEPPADLSFGYVGAIQSVRGAPLIVNKETAIEVDVVKRGGPAVQGIRVAVNASSQYLTSFYLKEGATVESKWQLTQLHENLDLPAGDCRRTLYFFADSRRLVPRSAEPGLYQIEARAFLGQDPGPIASRGGVQEILDHQWGSDSIFKILCIPADWEFLGFPKENYLVAAAEQIKAHAQSCFPFADEGVAGLYVSSSRSEQSTEEPPYERLRDVWPSKGSVLGDLYLWVWLQKEKSIWATRGVSSDRLAFLVPEGWFRQRGGRIKGGNPGGVNYDFMVKNLVMAEALQQTGYTNYTPGWLATHELAHSFWLKGRDEVRRITNALDVANKRVVEDVPNQRVVGDLLYDTNIVTTGGWSEDRWLIPEDYALIARGGGNMWWPPTLTSASDRRSILISALLMADGEVELLPWYVLDQADTDIDQIPEGNEFFLEYLDDVGRVIYSRGFPNLTAPDGENLEIVPLVFTAPYLNGVRTIRLRRQAETVFQREVSANPPMVTITSPISGAILADEVRIGWSASDVDGGNLLCSLTAYGEEEGNIWPLADELEGSSFVWDATKLPVGRYRLEALVTDGVNTAKQSVWVRKIQRTNLPLIFNPARPTPTPTVTPTPTSTPTQTATPAPTNTPTVRNIGKVRGHIYDRETGQIKQGVTVCLGSTDGRDNWGGSSTSDEDGVWKFWWLPIDPNSGLDCAVWICDNGSCHSNVHLTLSSPESGPIDFWVDDSNYCR